MAKLKHIVIFVLFISVGLFVIRAKEVTLSKNDNRSNFNYIETKLFESSRYTQQETIDSLRLDKYHNELSFYPTQDYLDKYGYVSYDVLEDEFIKVYVEKDSFSVIVYDKVADYYYSSRPEFQGYEGKLEGNLEARRRMNSGIWIEMVPTNKPEQSAVSISSLYSFAEVSFVSEADAPTTPENPFTMVENSYNKNKVEVSETIDQNVTFHIDIKAISFSFDVVLAVDKGSLTLNIPNESIKEDMKTTTVISITLLPYFGSTRENYTPGYVLIPDGVGALVRLDKPSDFVINARFYGDDYGYSRRYYNQLSVPLFGYIHETNNRGFYAHVSEGDEQTLLTAEFYGKNNYNRVSLRFLLREVSRRIIDQAGNGRDSISEVKTSSNYHVHYNFLQSEASYVGIANDYKDYLLQSEKLYKQPTKADISVQTTYLMSDLEPSIFGQRRVVMTRAKDVLNMYHILKENGLNNQSIHLLGYSKNGASAGLTKTNFFESSSGYKKLKNQLEEDNNHLFLHQDYTFATNLSTRMSDRRDLAKTTAKVNLTFSENQQTIKTINPYQASLKASNDVKFINTYGGIHVDSLGSTLFSYYDKTIKPRNVMMSYYEEVVSKFENVSLSKPNSYLWKYINEYKDLSITNMQYVTYTDLVPFIPIILQGVMPVYTPYLNFNALGIERLLMMVDFNVYPSYILTNEDTFKMRYTPNRYYTTKFEDFKEDMISDYTFLNNALRHIRDAYLTDRVIIETGVVINSYNNGVKIIINYTSEPTTILGVTIDAQSYEVIL